MKSIKPKKQRKKIFEAKLHQKKAFLNAHLSKELRKELKRRSLGVREGDKVKIMRGSFKGKSGKVTKCEHKKGRIFVEKINRKKSDGTEVMIPLKASNLLILELERKDERRLKRMKKTKEEEEKTKKHEAKEKEEKSGKEKHKEEIKEKPKEKIETKKKEEKLKAVKEEA